ncbi:phosphodiesterase [Aeromicrobium sp. Marseille-Q0843]|uniref:Phosphodiesterase n=1 Tax=Aeromicrobium phoceense TaxID=2754045 RepID=A0A838XE23_9ACTN|nr:phosphodiesterase [Aeromicrobium phoceense]
MTQTRDRTKDLYESISRSGYYPEIVAGALEDALAAEPVESFVVHHEPTFDREEIRRHMSVLVLTPTRLLLTHTDEHPGDTLLPKPYTSTSVEAVPLSRVSGVVVTRMVSAQTQQLEEALLTIGWGAVARVELEPARCDDPECEADHGYTGSISGDDFSLRLSAAAEGGAAVVGLLEFARALTAATTVTEAR